MNAISRRALLVLGGAALAVGLAGKNARSQQADPEGGLVVGNAGLVILWPFLSRYFQELGLTNGSTFSSDAGQQRAVRLTQYLVTGQGDAPDDQLLLNKILCGRDEAATAGPSIALTEAERALSKSLLSAARQSVPPWHDLSDVALQDSFLRRRGLVRRPAGEDALVLSVEEAPFDLLLDQVPWSISTVWLPWMPAPLQVLWR